VGWSTAYYARTILYAQKKGLKNIDKITENAFSPGFVYNATTAKLGSVDKDCEKGTDIGEALYILQDKGALFIKDFPDECYQGDISSFFQKANANKIKTFMRLSDKSEDNILVRSYKGVYGRGSQVDASEVSSYMLDIEFSWEENIEDIENFVKNLQQ
jgi:hypothetical protein